MVLACLNMKRHFLEDTDMDILSSKSFSKRLRLGEENNVITNTLSDLPRQMLEASSSEFYAPCCQDLSCIGSHKGCLPLTDSRCAVSQKDAGFLSNFSAAIEYLSCDQDQKKDNEKPCIDTHFDSLNSTLRVLHRQREDRRLSKKKNTKVGISSSPDSLCVPKEIDQVELCNLDYFSEGSKHPFNNISKQQKFQIDYEARILLESQNYSEGRIAFTPFVFRNDENTNDHREARNISYHNSANSNDNDEMEVD